MEEYLRKLSLVGIIIEKGNLDFRTDSCAKRYNLIMRMLW